MSLAAVIVETRENDLFQIINEHLFYLPKDTVLYIFASEKHKHLIEMCNCNFFIADVNNLNDYNNLLTSKEFWLAIKEENILIFQTDSMLLRKGIEEFYEYDYVGAEWHFEPIVGNGGLSFRKKSAMINVINNYPKIQDINEDVYFSHGCKKLGLKIAPVEVARRFSIETIFTLGSMGYHAIDKYLTLEQCSVIKNQYKL